MKPIKNFLPCLLSPGFRKGAAFFIPLFLGLALLAGATPTLAEENSVRPEVGKPLQAAQELIKAKKHQEALTKIKEAEAIPNRNAYETFMIERMRGPAAAGAGDWETAGRAFETVINSGRLPQPEQLKMIEALAGTYYRNKDYAKAITWAQRYSKEGGNQPQLRTLLVQAQFLGGDYVGAVKELQKELKAEEEAGRTWPEDRFQLLANCQVKLNDWAGYTRTLELLVTHYPKKEYWLDLISRIQRKPGFADRLNLDALRLLQATGNLHEPGDYVEMTQLAIQAGLPAEAKRIITEAYAKDILGKGPEAERHKRLKDLANKQDAEDQKTLTQSINPEIKDGNTLVNAGYALVTNGQLDKGIALIEKGIQKGDLKRPEDAKLHLGLAYLQAGNKDKARQAFRSVQGNDGAADIAKLWIIQIGRG